MCPAALGLATQERGMIGGIGWGGGPVPFWEIFGTGRAKLALDRYFGVDRASNRVDVRAAGGQASCCGVNLAFAAFGLGVGWVGFGWVGGCWLGGWVLVGWVGLVGLGWVSDPDGNLILFAGPAG